MNGEVSEATGQVVSALKGQPLVLALVLMNFALLAFLYFEGQQNWRQRGDYVKETQALLSKCVSVEELERLQRLK